MCQVFLDIIFIMPITALYFCTLFPATALSLAGLDDGVRLLWNLTPSTTVIIEGSSSTSQWRMNEPYTD